MYSLRMYMYVQLYSIYKVWISPIINTKNTIGVQQIVYEALCNCAMGYFTSIFAGIEMAQMVNVRQFSDIYKKSLNVFIY